jgi:hypothetical protein
VTDPIIAAAQFLLAQLDWCRHATDEQGGAYAAGVFAEIGDCAGRMRSLVEGPAAQRYLGPCGAAQIAVDVDAAAAHGIHPANAALGLAPCDGDVYGRAGADKGRCKTCGAEVSQDERRAWLDSEVRLHTYTVVEIADAYPIKANTIRQWLSRGLLVAHGELNGRTLLNLGEVLDLAAGDAARREEARAERARRREGATA